MKPRLKHEISHVWEIDLLKGTPTLIFLDCIGHTFLYICICFLDDTLVRKPLKRDLLIT